MNATETNTPQCPDFGALLESIRESGRRMDENYARYLEEKKEREAKWELERKEREARWSIARSGTPTSRTRNSVWRWPPSSMTTAPKSTRWARAFTC